MTQAIQQQSELETLTVEFIRNQQLKPTSVPVYSGVIKNFVKYLQSEGVQRVEKDHILNYIESLKAQGLKPTTINVKIKVLKTFFSYLSSVGLTTNLTKGIKNQRVSKEHKRSNLTPEQINILLKATDNQRDKLIILLATVTGLRVSEIAKLRVKDLQFFNGRPCLIIKGKARDEEEPFPICTALFMDLMNFVNGTKPEDPIFCNSRHNNPEPITGHTISLMIKGLMTKVGIIGNQYTAHSLRHTAITNLINNNVDLMQIKNLSRHASLDTLMIYVHENDKANNPATDINYKTFTQQAI